MQTSTYKPFVITAIFDGERRDWDRYGTRATANRNLADDVECFGLVDARVEFRGVWSRYPTQDRDLAKIESVEEAREMISWVSAHLAKDWLTVRSRKTYRALLAGARKRLASLEA